MEAAQLGALALAELSKDAGIWSSPGKVDLDWALDEPADDDSLLDDLLRAGASPDAAKDRGQISAGEATGEEATGSLRTDPALDDIFAPVPLARKPLPVARTKVAYRRAKGWAPLPSDPDLDDILSQEPPPER